MCIRDSILVDDPRQLRLKILGRVEIFEGEQAREWIKKVRDPEHKAFTERVYAVSYTHLDVYKRQYHP